MKQLRSYLIIIILFTVNQAISQPMVSHFLAIPSDVSRGRSFKTIEEISEVKIRGISTVPHKVFKEFNHYGNIVSRVSYNSAGGVTSEMQWEYADGEKLIRKHHRYFANIVGWQEEEVSLTWDEKGDLPKRIEVSKNGQLWQSAQMSFDTLGRIEYAKVYNSKGSHVFTERFMYIEPSNILRVMVFRENGLFAGTWTYPIDITKEFTFESVTRQYYPNGEIMIETLSDAAQGDQIYFYEYAYDSQGNWIEKKTYQAKLGRNNRVRRKKLENEVSRTITYQ